MFHAPWPARRGTTITDHVGTADQFSADLSTSVSSLVTTAGLGVPFAMEELREALAGLLGIPIVVHRVPMATSAGTGSVFFDPRDGNGCYRVLVQSATSPAHQDFILGHEFTHLWRGHLDDPAGPNSQITCRHSWRSTTDGRDPDASRLAAMEREANQGALILSTWSHRLPPPTHTPDPDLRRYVADMGTSLIGIRWQ